MTAIAPSAHRTVVVVVVGAVLIAVGALVVGRVVPQKLLIATALTSLLLTDVVSSRLQSFAPAAVGAVVVGSAWSFGLWCSFSDFPLWPGLVPAAVIAAAAVFFAVNHAGDGVALSARLAPFHLVMLIAMVLSWSFVKRGVAGFLVGVIFVVWAAFRLFVTVVQAPSDADDAARVARGAVVLSFGADLAWNCLVCWARLAPDDDDGAAALGW